MTLVSQMLSLLLLGYKERRRIVKIRKTKILIKILQLFYDEGLIKGYTISNDLKHIFIFLKYYENKALFSEFKLFSSNRFQYNVSAFLISKYFSNKGFFIFSTDKYGLIFSNRLLRKNLTLKKKVGGILLFQIYF